jgi:hypothetical protein
MRQWRPAQSSSSEDRIYHIDDPDVDKALRYVLEINGVVHVHQRGGRYFFDKRKQRTKEYVTVAIPPEKLETLRLRFSRGEQPQDFEGLIEIPKRKPQPQRKPGGRK